MIKFKDPWSGEVSDAMVVANKYLCNDRLALQLEYFDDEFQYWAPYCSITVNLDNEQVSNENCGFLDTNNAPFLVDFVIQNGLGVPTGRVGYSGFCVYPEFDFTKFVEGDANGD